MFPDDPDYVWLWRGYEDYVEWVEKWDPVKFPGKDLYLKHCESLGRPTFERKSFLQDNYDEEQIGWLLQISEKYRP